MAKKIPSNATNEAKVDSNIIDLDLSVTRSKKIRFDKDDNRVVDINISDINIISRLSEAEEKLNTLQAEATEAMTGVVIDEDTGEGISDVGEILKRIDTEMRELIDFIFDAPVSAAAAPKGSMYDPFEGTFRYDYIISVLIAQYEANIVSEFDKMEKKMQKHTAKYN